MGFNQYDCYVDASVKDGKGSIAVVIVKNGKKIIELSQPTKSAEVKGINTAELLSVNFAMSEILRLKRDGETIHRVVIHTDSDFAYTVLSRIFYIYDHLGNYKSLNLLAAAFAQCKSLQEFCRLDLVKVKGHGACVMHNRAHELAYKALSGDVHYVRYGKNKHEQEDCCCSE